MPANTIPNLDGILQPKTPLLFELFSFPEESEIFPQVGGSQFGFILLTLLCLPRSNHCCERGCIFLTIKSAAETLILPSSQCVELLLQTNSESAVKGAGVRGRGIGVRNEAPPPCTVPDDSGGGPHVAGTISK